MPCSPGSRAGRARRPRSSPGASGRPPVAEPHRHAWALTELRSEETPLGQVYHGRYYCPGCATWQTAPISPKALTALRGPDGVSVADMFAPPELAPADTSVLLAEATVLPALMDGSARVLS